MFQGISRLVVMSVSAIVLIGVAHAQSTSIVTGTTDKDVTTCMAHKWARGITNAVTGVVEIPVQTVKGWNNGVSAIKNDTGSHFAGAGLGLWTGLGNAVGRTWYGVFEMATFWAANPETNASVGVALDTEYAWSMDDGSFAVRDRVTPFYAKMGNKIVRGGSDFFLGVTDVPCQVRMAANDGERSVAGGIGSGLWYWVSREVNGANDLVTFLLPNPEDQVGSAYLVPDPWNFLTKTPPAAP